MKYAKFLLVLILNLVVGFVSAQTDTSQHPINRKVGLYRNYQAFLDNKPFTEKAFKLVVKFDEKDNKVTGRMFEFIDSTPPTSEAWGIFYRDTLYFKIGKHLYRPMYETGRYSFIIDNERLLIKKLSFTLTSMMTSKIDFLPSKYAFRVEYFNERGQDIIASDQTIGFLIRKEKDLWKQYNAEPKITSEVLVKYLKLMNKRYPF